MHDFISALTCLLMAALVAGVIGFEKQLRAIARGIISRRLKVREEKLSSPSITTTLNIVGAAVYLGLLAAALWVLAARSG